MNGRTFTHTNAPYIFVRYCANVLNDVPYQWNQVNNAMILIEVNGKLWTRHCKWWWGTTKAQLNNQHNADANVSTSLHVISQSPKTNALQRKRIDNENDEQKKTQHCQSTYTTNGTRFTLKTRCVAFVYVHLFLYFFLCRFCCCSRAVINVKHLHTKVDFVSAAIEKRAKSFFFIFFMVKILCGWNFFGWKTNW